MLWLVLRWPPGVGVSVSAGVRSAFYSHIDFKSGVKMVIMVSKHQKPTLIPTPTPTPVPTPRLDITQ